MGGHVAGIALISTTPPPTKPPYNRHRHSHHYHHRRRHRYSHCHHRRHHNHSHSHHHHHLDNNIFTSNNNVVEFFDQFIRVIGECTNAWPCSQSSTPLIDLSTGNGFNFSDNRTLLDAIPAQTKLKINSSAFARHVHIEGQMMEDQ